MCVCILLYVLSCMADIVCVIQHSCCNTNKTIIIIIKVHRTESVSVMGHELTIRQLYCLMMDGTELCGVINFAYGFFKACIIVRWA